ncbi:ABC transporter substrate-binding protein [Aureimonas sp. ME7]|uniref:ABC transporter substrate-binding protein n=1 Tax=Aureimonas sp. ME7 TaxID=2744252 RepID=UPI0015F64716|nr:ABC transporter substrate-binding protein [Aureimonas sp. ME7]
MFPTRLALALAIAVLGATAPAGAKTFVFCSEGDPESLSPQLSITGTAMDAAKPMFNTLVEFRPGTTEIRPALAERWEISPDGLEYTFHLRPGIAFHANADFEPSRTLEAQDVVFSLERQWKADHPFHAVSGARFDYFQDSGFPDLLRSIEVVDALTVRIRLTRPEAPFLASLAMPFMSILSAEYADRLLENGHPERLDTAPIGTGPFEFVSFQPGVSIRYHAFEHYWRGRQPIDTLVFSITPTTAARLTKLTAGECHMSAFPDAADLARLRSDPELKLYETEGLNVGYLAMNTTRKPFDDVRVRRAVNMAIDRQAILDAVYGPSAILATNPIPPSLWAFDERVEPYPYNVAAARKLLIEAGLPDGLDTDLWYMPVSRPYNPNARRVAEMIAADLEKLGIRLRLKTSEWNAYRVSILENDDVSLALYGWAGDNGDPDNFLHTLLGCAAVRPGGNNVARWCDADYDRLVREAKTLSDPAGRRALYLEAQEIFHREAPWVPLAHSIFSVAARREVTGYVADPLFYHSFEGVDLVDRENAVRAGEAATLRP